MGKWSTLPTQKTAAVLWSREFHSIGTLGRPPIWCNNFDGRTERPWRNSRHRRSKPYSTADFSSGAVDLAPRHSPHRGSRESTHICGSESAEIRRRRRRVRRQADTSRLSVDRHCEHFPRSILLLFSALLLVSPIIRVHSRHTWSTTDEIDGGRGRAGGRATDAGHDRARLALAGSSHPETIAVPAIRHGSGVERHSRGPSPRGKSRGNARRRGLPTVRIRSDESRRLTAEPSYPHSRRRRAKRAEPASPIFPGKRDSP